MSEHHARSEPRPPRILVVEDDPAIAEVTALLLAQEGYAVTTAANGLEALEVVAQSMPDLILVDLKMPVMDGSTFIAELRRRYRVTPPIVILTATLSPETTAAELAVAGHLEKPFDLDDLLACVQRYTQAVPPGTARAA